MAKNREQLQASDDVTNEAGERGRVDGLFCVDSGLYTAVLIGDKHWRTPSGRPRSKRLTVAFRGWTARDLAAELRAHGWVPPRGLARLCESARTSSWQVRRG